ncbi:MAG: hypothetical protein ABSG77_04035 [Candidatus Acidiferrum sp.]
MLALPSCQYNHPVAMADNTPPTRFRPDMPIIPGVNGPSSKLPRRNPLLPLVIGFLVLGVLLLLGSRWLSHNKPSELARVEPPPQIEVPAPAPDPSASLPHATEANPAIAEISDLAKPWSSADFFIRNRLSGENIPATIVRLPGGSATSPYGYWAFSRKAPYGPCQLEYITDLEKLKTEYGFRAPNHPLVGNPCSHTLYDPLKTASLLGNIWIRGAIVQGSDIRPPFGVELQIQGKQILAIRSE